MDPVENRVARGLGLLSGGLDSILACLVLRKAGAEVEAISFTSPFFDADKAKAAARAHKIPLTVLDVSAEHLEQVVKNPRYGYGGNMNPCIDCHAYMFKKAGEVMEEKGLDFLFSGEVLGQRPMSQNRGSLNAVANYSGVPDKILRPLSAKLLNPTPMEESGLVDREKLLEISGRGRKEQMALAKALGVKDYPAPAGGCLLTEPGFSRRLRDLLEYEPSSGPDRARLLKHGRHLRLSDRAKLVVGRNQVENKILEGMAGDEDLKLSPLDFSGPLGLYSGPADGPELELAAAIVAGYGKPPADSPARIKMGDSGVLSVTPLARRKAHSLIL